MSVFVTFLMVIQVLSALGIIVLVLLQHGKGADMGAAFGSGASGSLFGATGSANFLSRTTAVLAAVFFIATAALAYTASVRPTTSGGVMENVPQQSAPAQPAGGPAPGAAATSEPAKDAAKPAEKANDIPK